MNILAISTRIPAPGRKGDQVVAFYRLAHLVKRGHSVRLICFGDNFKRDDLDARTSLQALGIHVVLIKWSPFEAFFNLFLAIPNTAMPFQVALFKSRIFSAEVSTAIDSFKPDLLYCITIRVSQNIPIKYSEFVIDFIDSMILNFSRRKNTGGFFEKFIYSLELSRLKKFEINLANMSRRSFVVSELDRRAIGSEKIHVTPLGIDLNQFFKRDIIIYDPVIVFSGNMSYQPNIDAVVWFLKNCWNKLKSENSNIRFIITGSDPHSQILELSSGDPNILVTGRVTSIADVLRTAMIAVAPMQSGSGMQFKILEAMACGVPVIATTLGLGNINASVGNDLFVSDTPDEFVQTIIKLIEDFSLRQRVGESGRNFVFRSHSWSALNSIFETRLIESLDL
jgi:glycosyltransferase involved in cell wall biosynthesis